MEHVFPEDCDMFFFLYNVDKHETIRWAGLGRGVAREGEEGVELGRVKRRWS